MIRAALWDEDPAVRLVASMALWKVDRKGPLVVPALIKALDDANELICWIAVEFLGEMGPAAREAVPALRQAQRDNRTGWVWIKIKLKFIISNFLHIHNSSVRIEQRNE